MECLCLEVVEMSKKAYVRCNKCEGILYHKKQFYDGSNFMVLICENHGEIWGVRI